MHRNDIPIVQFQLIYYCFLYTAIDTSTASALHDADDAVREINSSVLGGAGNSTHHNTNSTSGGMGGVSGGLRVNTGSVVANHRGTPGEWCV